MKRCLVAILAVSSTILLAAQDLDGQKWIDRLKTTPVSQLDPALPAKPFAEWLNDLVKPAHPGYEVNDCGERNGTAEEKGKEFPLCVSVRADVSPLSRLELRFVVATYVVPQNASAKPAEKPAKMELFQGTLGPSNPRIKRPTRLIRKLSEVGPLLHPETSPGPPQS